MSKSDHFLAGAEPGESGNPCVNSCGIDIVVQMRTRIMNQLQAVAMNEGLRRKRALALCWIRVMVWTKNR
jgi:hypothetical protein